MYTGGSVDPASKPSVSRAVTTPEAGSHPTISHANSARQSGADISILAAPGGAGSSSTEQERSHGMGQPSPWVDLIRSTSSVLAPPAA